MSTSAPAIGGASTSHSAWNPYAVLPQTIKRRVDPKALIPATTSYLPTLSIPEAVATERLAGKYLQLDPPEGKESDWRKLELAGRAREVEKKKIKRIKEGDCGLIGRRKRKRLAKVDEKVVRYDSVLPIHHLWLGYMAEITNLPILIPTLLHPPVGAATPPPTETTTTLLPMYPPRNPPPGTNATTAADLKINVISLHAKLVKAEFIGCILTVKRAKNPSLAQLSGIVLQETQSTFKIVTTANAIKILPKKGSIFTFFLPLTLPRSTTTTTTSREISFDIFGDAFQFRSADRVNKKWKVGSGSGAVELN